MLNKLLRDSFILGYIGISDSSHDPTFQKSDTHPQFTNDLISSGSTYLRQHAHQPVQWRAWSDQAL
ncbi:MAG: DUF255 domain-containing protein, partial [Candidatus Woesearchaeota archaeon]|nr:DUF255 domain-containing protein [Candidatus Woesearchaeota archaeon]